MQRLNTIDALRGVCALLVVIQHSLSFPGSPASAWILQYADMRRIGVAAFFLISGFVIPFSIGDGDSKLTKFWISRFFRLWPIYWVSIGITLALGHVSLNARDVVINLSMLQAFFGVPDVIGVFWTLQIELIFYAIVSAIAAAGRLNLKTAQQALYACLCIGLLMAAARWMMHIKFPVALPIALSMMFLAMHAKYAGRLSPGLSGLFVATLVPICLMAYGSSVSSNDNPVRWICSYSIALTIFALTLRARSAPRWLAFTGAISYSVYLFHSAVIETLASHTSIGFIAGTIAACIATIALSSLTYFVIEKPCQNLGRSIIRRRYSSERLATAS